jgi:hypothetical protein
MYGRYVKAFRCHSQSNRPGSAPVVTGAASAFASEQGGGKGGRRCRPGGLLELLGNGFQHSFEQPLSAGLVVDQLFRVPVVSAVQLHDQTPVKADKIDDVPLFVQISRTGYAAQSVQYEPERGSNGPSLNRTFGEAFRYFMSMFIFNSLRPLRVMSYIGLTGSFLAFLIGMYSFVIHLVKRYVVEGWTTLNVFTSSQFFLMFIILAFLGEYLARVLDNQSNSQAYEIVFERHSSVMVDTLRRNVLDESTCDDINLVQTGRDR